MIKVENEVLVYEINGKNVRSAGEELVIKVKSHSARRLVTVEIPYPNIKDRDAFSVSAEDLLAAIQNAKNSGDR